MTDWTWKPPEDEGAPKDEVQPEPVTETEAEPVAEPVGEPVAEPVAEPVVEPVSEPVAEAVTEPPAQPDFLAPSYTVTDLSYMGTQPFDDIAVELETLTEDQRGAVFAKLTDRGIPYRTEGATLFVRTDEATRVQGLVAEVANPEPVEELLPPLVIDTEEIEETIEEADEDEDEIVFDLAALSAEERRHLSMRLTGAGITHIWEVATDLVVSVKDAEVIETYVEEVRNPDGFGDEEIIAFDEDSDVDDEAIYAAMSNLYVAADKLMTKPADDALAGNFYLAADDVEGLPAPFGFDPRVWQQVLGLTDKIVAALDAESDPDGIGTDANTLRQLLVKYV